jgi:hypothetical protein
VCHNVHLTLKFVCCWISYSPSHPVISIKQTKRGPISFVFFLLSNGLLPLFDSSGRTGCWRPHQPFINSLDHQSADGHISTVTSQCYALRLRYVSVFLPFLFPFFFLLSFSIRLLHTSPPAGTCLSLEPHLIFLVRYETRLGTSKVNFPCFTSFDLLMFSFCVCVCAGRAGPFETCVNVTSGEEGRCMFAMVISFAPLFVYNLTSIYGRHVKEKRACVSRNFQPFCQHQVFFLFLLTCAHFLAYSFPYLGGKNRKGKNNCARFDSNTSGASSLIWPFLFLF